MFGVILFVLSAVARAQWSTDLFVQSVHLHKFDNTIMQGFVHVKHPWKNIEPYAGVWFDQDTKTGKKEAYTDAQVSPVVGVKTQLFGASFVPSRAFSELRFVQRTVTFPDERAHSDWEARVGLLGYDFITPKAPFFFEHYYALFYTRLYDDRVILQGWTRQGIRQWEHADIFNEILVDTFDQSRGRDATIDWRPGVRVLGVVGQLNVQLLHQYLHHFSNLAFAGRSEQRTTLVLGASW